MPVAASEEELKQNLDELLSTQKELQQQKDEIVEIKGEVRINSCRKQRWNLGLGFKNRNCLLFSTMERDARIHTPDEIPDLFGMFDSLIHDEDKEHVLSHRAQYLK